MGLVKTKQQLLLNLLRLLCHPNRLLALGPEERPYLFCQLCFLLNSQFMVFRLDLLEVDSCQQLNTLYDIKRLLFFSFKLMLQSE